MEEAPRQKLGEYGKRLSLWILRNQGKGPEKGKPKALRGRFCLAADGICKAWRKQPMGLEFRSLRKEYCCFVGTCTSEKALGAGSGRWRPRPAVAVGTEKTLLLGGIGKNGK